MLPIHSNTKHPQGIVEHRMLRWLAAIMLVCAIYFIPCTAYAQPDITRIEYYFDTDPGFGNATPISFTSSTDIQNKVIPIDPASISVGVHRFYVRALDANGNWSLTNTLLFYKPYGVPPAPVLPEMDKLEYYIDDDPGYGNGVPVALGSLTDLADYVVPVDITGLAAGVHTFWVRGLDKNGNWGLVNNWSFSISSVLPVTYVSFTATAQRDKVVLQWSTATELNSKNFSVQRSLDGITFETIATVKAAGNSNTTRNYRFDDLQSISFRGKVVYFRIVESDINNRELYTSIRNVKIADGKNTLTLRYNPVNNQALLKYESLQTGEAIIRVVDHLGRTVMSKQLQVVNGDNQITLQTGNLAKGIYDVELISNQDHSAVRMIKE